MLEPFIQTRNMVKTYDTPAGPLNVLRGVDLKLGRGDFVALLGPSGSGKNTLINMITGIDRPTTGEVYVAGERLTHLSENKVAKWRGRNVGAVFQFFQPLPALTVIENVGLVFALFEELVSQNKTIIMVTHDWELAGQIPRVEEVRDGRLVAEKEIDRRLVSRG